MITKAPFFAHPTSNMDESKSFYQNVLGLKIEKEFGNVWVEFALPDGNTLAVETFSKEGPYLALESDDIEKEVVRLKEQGVKVIQDVWENKDDDGHPFAKWR